MLFVSPAMADVMTASDLVSGLGLFLNASVRGQRKGKLGLMIERQLWDQPFC